MLPKMTSFGACVSRDLFKSSIVRDYKDFFDFSNDQYHMSVVSLMSQSLSEDILTQIPEIIEGDVNNFVKKCFKEDLTKSFLEKIKTFNQDYMLLDFYMDTYYGVIELDNGSYISGKEWQYKKIEFYNEVIAQHVQQVITPLQHKEKYMSLWKKSIDEFMLFMKTYSKDTKIILNTKKFTNKFYNEKNEVFEDLSVVIKDAKRDASTIAELNLIWDEMNEYLLTNYANVEQLVFDEDKYYSSDSNEWGAFYLHFNKEFYEEAQQQLINIVLSDRGYFKLEQVLPGGICKKIDDNANSFDEIREWGYYYLPTNQYLKLKDKPNNESAGYFLQNHAETASGFFIQELTRASLKTTIQSYKRIVTKTGYSEWNSVDIGDEVIYLSKVGDLKDMSHRGEYYITDKVARTIVDHPTQKSGWFLNVSKKTKDSCVQELIKKTTIDANMQRFYRILNFKEKTATSWMEQSYMKVGVSKEDKDKKKK